MKNFSEMIRQASLISQFGLSLIVPVLMFLGGAWLLNVKAGWGLWVYIPGFIIGLCTSFMTAYNFYMLQIKKADKKKDEHKVYFNTHE